MGERKRGEATERKQINRDDLSVLTQNKIDIREYNISERNIAMFFW